MSGKKPVLDRSFWSERFKRARYPHHAVYCCSRGEWQRIMERHRKILKEQLEPNTSVLDIGCGYGRLLDSMPTNWKGDYLGIDFAQEFIDYAQELYPGRQFVCGNILDVLPELDKKFDVAIAGSIRRMLIDNVGQEYWNKIEALTLKVANRLIVLEYLEDEAEVIESDLPSE